MVDYQRLALTRPHGSDPLTACPSVGNGALNLRRVNSESRPKTSPARGE